MKILSIETSCDETAVSLVEAKGGLTEPYFVVAGNALFSQIEIHKKYGGVFPTLAKREHGKNLTPLLVDTLSQAGEYEKTAVKNPDEIWQKIEKILDRENDLASDLKKFFDGRKKPAVDFIAVTSGPGLEPALWVGISFARALGVLWNIPVLPVNHMEGHIASVLLNKTNEFKMQKSKCKIEKQEEKTETKSKIQTEIKFPAVALLISGGHTELVKIAGWGKYKIIGQTRDDAVGEAFDKVARMLGLPYPGGPEISRLAEIARTENLPKVAKLPRPMMHSNDFDFSFSGLKTAVLYWIRDHGELSERPAADVALPSGSGLIDSVPMSQHFIADIAREFEDAVVEVLVRKTESAVEETNAKTLVVAGGVISNKKLREEFENFSQKYPGLSVRIPLREMTTDNSLMIAIAGFVDVTQNPELLLDQKTIIANGNLRLS
jgi:N6-L-threonylcarbamoyladenine synthase